MKGSWVTLLLLVLSGSPAWSQESAAESEAPPVGGLFGLLRGARPTPTSAPAERATAVPTAEEAPPKAEAPQAVPTAVAPLPTLPAPARATEAPPPATEPTPAEEEEEQSKPPPESGAAKEPAKKAPAEPAAPTRGAKDRGAKSDVELPPTEIQGEIEKPDIFFLVPRARDQSDEQMIRARIKREITRPVIKDWVEEEMLLK